MAVHDAAVDGRCTRPPSRHCEDGNVGEWIEVNRFCVGRSYGLQRSCRVILARGNGSAEPSSPSRRHLARPALFIN